MVATLFGLVACPAAADDSGVPNLFIDTGASHQDAMQADLGSQGALATRLDASYRWNDAGGGQPATQMLPDEPTSRTRAAVQIALGLIMIVLVVAGFTIAITSLRADIRKRRIVYHRRVRI